MYGVVNPSGSDSLANYGSLASAATSVSNPSSVFGGVLSNSGNNNGGDGGGFSTTTAGFPQSSSPYGGGGYGGYPTSTYAYGGSGSNPTTTSTSNADVARAGLGSFLGAVAAAFFMM